MRRFTVVRLACLAIVGFAATRRLQAQDPTRTLAGYRGHNRVLLIFAASGRSPEYMSQRRRWDSEKTGFADRDLVTMPVFAAARRSTPLAGKYGIHPGRFAVVLIGKDGNEAFRSEQPVPATELYNRIDAMPMRREEMRRKSAGKVPTES